MVKLIGAFCFLITLVACNSQKQQAEPLEESTPVVVVESDTLDVEKAEDALPARADELFDDFMYNFSQDTAVQRVRTFFPLPYYTNGENNPIKKSEWQFDASLNRDAFYFILFNDEKEMELVSDTSLIQVRMDLLNVEARMAKRYQFKRYQGVGVWCLYSVTSESFTEERDAVDFWDFYYKFASDKDFQSKHVREPLKFVTIDPDDDFNVIETTLDKKQWFAFQPTLPQHHVTFIDYGQQYGDDSQEKLLCLRGRGNGIYVVLKFRRDNDDWMLESFEDTSE